MVDLPKAEAPEGAERAPKAKGRKSREGREDAGGDSFDYQYETEVSLPANAVYQLTFHLLAERQVKEDPEGGLVTADSVTFDIVE